MANLTQRKIKWLVKTINKAKLMILFEKREQKEKRFRLCEKYDILFC